MLPRPFAPRTQLGLLACVLVALVMMCSTSLCAAFLQSRSKPMQHSCKRLSVKCKGQKQPVHQESSSSSSDRLRQEAQELLAQAQALRNDIQEESKSISELQTKTTTQPSVIIKSPWTISSDDDDDKNDTNFVDYRLYVDIGREEGTWMDPRWAASGRRIEFTMDVRLLTAEVADPETAKGMVKDNFGGQSSPVYRLQSAPNARLRQGFDRMKCHGGAYRVDRAPNGSRTIRFFISVDGTTVLSDNDSSYGDVSIPSGNLFFSLPAFGPDGVLSQLSRKEGPVTVRQIGWHTGWRREESRIVGIFKAVPIADAQRRDGF